MSKYEHIFFDLDRTLWDFEKNSQEVLEDLFRSYDLQGKGIPDLHTFIGVYRGINKHYWIQHREGKVDKDTLRTKRFKDSLQKFGIRDEALSYEMGERYIRDTPRKTALIEGAVPVLDRLAKYYRLHIITNGFEETQHTKLEGTSLKGRFDVIVTSDKAQARKPSREIFDRSLEEAGAEPDESLMVGDDPEADIIGAQHVPMDQVLLDPEGIHDHVEPTYRIRRLEELGGILLPSDTNEYEKD